MEKASKTPAGADVRVNEGTKDVEGVVDGPVRESTYVTAKDTTKRTFALVIAKPPSEMLEEPAISAKEWPNRYMICAREYPRRCPWLF